MAITIELSLANLSLFSISVIFLYSLYKYLTKPRPKNYSKWDAPSKKGKVILHSIENGKTLPNISPFVLKLETFLRANKIPYEIDVSDSFEGPKGKIPWISFDAVHMGDSQLIIEFLTKKLNLKEPNKYTKSQLAISSSLRIMVENHLVWGLAIDRWVKNISLIDQVMKISKFEKILYGWLIGNRIKKTMVMTGLGKHSDEEFKMMMEGDMRTISAILDKNKFILGNEICFDDFAIFGMLAECLYALPNSHLEKLIKGELTNLREYVERIKDLYWEDWNKILSK